ncbi:MAG TPA: sulfatase, partial [Saprospiraceae bacterium]|nr:sulfatase [Saprospiraceae bacterium]
MDIDFRKGIPMMKEMLLLRDNGQLNSTQMMWFNSTKSAEEFYDLKNDPYQLNNLINDPRHQKDITVMRKELLKWIKDTSDLGAIPEKVLIKNMWNDQDTPPKTEMPVAISSNNNFTIKCGTKNASIGYRKLGETSWNVYKKPLKMKDTDLEIIAMRIGYEPSEILTLKTRKSTSY